MMLSIRTDSPTAEIGLWDNEKKVELFAWEAGRQLSEQLLAKITELLTRQNSSFDDLHGIVVFKGPGSFTGLRIGVTVANAIAYSKNIPIVGSGGDNWQPEGISRLAKNEDDKQVVPEYGAPPNVTHPKK